MREGFNIIYVCIGYSFLFSFIFFLFSNSASVIRGPGDGIESI